MYCSKESDWWEAVDVATGEMGTIPRNYVILDNNDKESQTYVHTVSLHYLVRCTLSRHRVRCRTLKCSMPW